MSAVAVACSRGVLLHYLVAAMQSGRSCVPIKAREPRLCSENDKVFVQRWCVESCCGVELLVLPEFVGLQACPVAGRGAGASARKARTAKRCCQHLNHTVGRH
jgi:hypothetical protein